MKILLVCLSYDYLLALSCLLRQCIVRIVLLDIEKLDWDNLNVWVWKRDRVMVAVVVVDCHSTFVVALTHLKSNEIHLIDSIMHRFTECLWISCLFIMKWLILL